MVETRSQSTPQARQAGAALQTPNAVESLTMPTDVAPTPLHQNITALGECATLLLTEFVPLVKNLVANDDEASCIEILLSTFLRKCTFSALDGQAESQRDSELPNGHGSPPSARIKPSAESSLHQLREEVVRMRTLVDGRMHSQLALSNAPRDQSDLGEPPGPPTISNIGPCEILVKISAGQIITALRRYDPKGLEKCLNQILSVHNNQEVSAIVVHHAELLKTGDLSITMRSSGDREILEAHPDVFEQAIPSAQVLTTSYKVLLKGFQPFSVKLVGKEDEVAFTNKLREYNPVLRLEDVGFVDFEPREDLTRSTTISLEFSKVEHANAAVENGILWEGQRRELEHFNLTCNLNFKNDHRQYCEEVRARRIDERRRREDEDLKDVVFRRSKLVHSYTSLGQEMFPAAILDVIGQSDARICDSSTASQKRPRDDCEDGMAEEDKGRKRPRFKTGQYLELGQPNPLRGAGEEGGEAVPGLLDGAADSLGGGATTKSIVLENGDAEEVEETCPEGDTRGGHDPDEPEVETHIAAEEEGSSSESVRDTPTPTGPTVAQITKSTKAARAPAGQESSDAYDEESDAPVAASLVDAMQAVYHDEENEEEEEEDEDEDEDEEEDSDEDSDAGAESGSGSESGSDLDSDTA